MQQQGYKPKLYLRDPTDYNPGYVSRAARRRRHGGLHELRPVRGGPTSRDAALQSWLRQVQPGATPPFFGVFAWSAARLFVSWPPSSAAS